MNSRIIVFILFFFAAPFAIKANPDIDKIKSRVVTELLTQEVDDDEIEGLLASIKEDGTWPGINYEDVSRTGFEHRFHYSNMVTLARAYKIRSSRFHKKKKVMKAIELSLQNWVDHDYFCDNWWYNQIGTPNSLVTLMLIVGDDLPDDLVEKTQPIIGRAHIDAPGARPGGDRIKIASIEAKNMLFLGNGERFEEVIRVIEGEIKFVEWVGATYGYGFRHIATGFSNRSAGGRGIQYDNSFHHRVDGVNNTLSYGLGYADAFVEWAVYTHDTQFNFSDEKLEQLIDYFLDGICKTAVFGKFPDMGAKNRSISREGALKAYSAETAEKLLLTSNYRRKELQEIVDIRSKNLKPTTAHATFYQHTEHFTFQRPDFFTSVRMYSTRTHNMEQPYNSEGLFNHYRGDGANHISRTGDEYYDIAPVYDYQKIPGATILQIPEMLPPNEIQKLGVMDFVGASTDGKYAAVGFDFRSPHHPLIARKSWFFFDQEYVCLGAGISTREKFPVVTTLNQCLLRDDVTISRDNQQTVISKGEAGFDHVDWVYQDGIGYVFPNQASVNIKNSSASGSWYRINKQTDSPKEEINLDVFKLWIDHGEAPSDASYEYIVVPATSVTELEQGTLKANIRIISNTPSIQAVGHEALGIYQIIFYKAGELDLSDGLILRSDSPAIVMLKTENRVVSSLSVSDPNRELGAIYLTLSNKIEKSGEDFMSVWNGEEKVSEISIRLPQGVYAGKSITIDLND